MTEGKIVTWLKNPGDKIAKGESVVVVESDKADMDVESFNDGILGSIVTQEGGTANVGEAIAFIAESEAELEEAKAKAGSNGVALSAAKQEPAPAEVTYLTPDKQLVKQLLRPLSTQMSTKYCLCVRKQSKVCLSETAVWGMNFISESASILLG